MGLQCPKNVGCGGVRGLLNPVVRTPYKYLYVFIIDYIITSTVVHTEKHEEKSLEEFLTV